MSTMLTITAYADAVKATERTVRRWLSDGLLTGAVKVDGAWLIPADALPRRDATPAPATPAEPGPGSVVVVASRRVPAALAGLPQGAGLAEALASQPAFLRLDVAAFLLGIPEASIKAHVEALGAVPYGRGGSLVVPARIVREAAGL